ncbi:WxcM-like domain-containing protein [Pedobacter frigoris]|uniref:WxcM-like domain-containing protein n=1 Tax=Pedobacter frigoris TaxID=2571272 RepID=UPI002931CFAF|nr:WxcM-like domain-containing protein [Pedobacter frigoris]
MTLNPALIPGGQHTDSRGTLTFLNDFDMSEVKRFYMIQNRDTAVIRAWRAHKIEQRWFYAINGEFLIRAVKIDNFDAPDNDLPIEEYTISAISNQVLHVPLGYATSVQAITNESKLLVFADYGIENAKFDDYLYPQDYFGK